MTRREIALLLAMVSSYDRRSAGEAEIVAWHAALDDIALEDAKQAVVAHFRESRDWLMPADVRRHVKASRQEQAGRQPAINSAAVRQTDPPPIWFETKRKLAAKRAKGGSLLAAVQDFEP